MIILETTDIGKIHEDYNHYEAMMGILEAERSFFDLTVKSDIFELREGYVNEGLITAVIGGVITLCAAIIGGIGGLIYLIVKKISSIRTKKKVKDADGKVTIVGTPEDDKLLKQRAKAYGVYDDGVNDILDDTVEAMRQTYTDNHEKRKSAFNDYVQQAQERMKDVEEARKEFDEATKKCQDECDELLEKMLKTAKKTKQTAEDLKKRAEKEQRSGDTTNAEMFADMSKILNKLNNGFMTEANKHAK